MKKLILIFALTFALLTACEKQAYVLLGGEKFQVEIANTPAERSVGLMNHENLAEDEAMLFVFDNPQIVSFWMKNMGFPIDILYFDSELKLREVIANAQPCEEEVCKSFVSQSPVKYVLEINANLAKKIDVKIGSELEIFNLNAK